VPETLNTPTGRDPDVAIAPELLTLTAVLDFVVTKVTGPKLFSTVIGPVEKDEEEAFVTVPVVGEVWTIVVLLPVGSTVSAKDQVPLSPSLSESAPVTV
jgi:hypothetical protein